MPAIHVPHFIFCSLSFKFNQLIVSWIWSHWLPSKCSRFHGLHGFRKWRLQWIEIRRGMRKCIPLYFHQVLLAECVVSLPIRLLLFFVPNCTNTARVISSFCTLVTLFSEISLWFLTRHERCKWCEMRPQRRLKAISW